MVFGLFKKNEFESRIKELEKKVKELEVKSATDLNYITQRHTLLRGDFDKHKDETQYSLKQAAMIVTLNSRVGAMEKIIKDKQNEKTPNPDVPKNKINTATAILNILKDSKNPLDFNSIKDKIKEYDLKSIDVSDKSIKQSIYNLVYAKKISRSKKNGKGMYQIRASTTKQ